MPPRKKNERSEVGMSIELAVSSLTPTGVLSESIHEGKREQEMKSNTDKRMTLTDSNE